MNAESYRILLYWQASLRCLQVFLCRIYSVFLYPSLRIRHLHDDVLHGDGHVRSHIRHHGRDDDVHVPRGHGHVRSHIPRHVRDGDVRVRPHRGHDGGRVRPHRDDDHSSTPRRHDGDDASVHVLHALFQLLLQAFPVRGSLRFPWHLKSVYPLSHPKVS